MSNIDSNYAIKISFITIIINVILALVKGIAAFMGNSAALFSDAIHSLSDVLSTFVVLIGVKMASKESDLDHPYGHERLESVAAILLSGLLMGTGLGIGYVGIEKLYTGSYVNSLLPTNIALYAAILSILVKEGMYWYTYLAAKKIKSDILMADAWHHRSDALSSVGSFVGIFGAQLGYPIMDSLASIIIALLIIHAAYEVFKNAIDKLVDKATDAETTEKLTKHILSQEDVLRIDSLKSRMFGNKIYIDVEIAVDAKLSLIQAHEIAEKVHHSIEENFENVKHCMVHVNPFEIEDNNK